MKIGIHHRPHSFSDVWIEYCKVNHIPYKIVDAYRYDIIEQLDDCDMFMWHFVQHNYKDMLVARQILNAVECAGKLVFPNFCTNWHFDDKVGEQYLLEAIGAPVVPAYVFYTRQEAFEWIENASFPKVFKLRGGAGASNVQLVKTRSEARRLAKQAFGKGFAQFDGKRYVKDRFRQFKEGPIHFFNLLKSLGRLLIPTEYSRMHGRERGYLYFQEFIPDNLYDIRVIVCGKKAFAIKRMVRKGDFRASGSGHIVYDKQEIDEQCVELSFEINRHIRSQSLALDFVFDKNNKPLVVELSYCYSYQGYEPCPGYWTEDMLWHKGKVESLVWQVENLIQRYKDLHN